MQDKMLKPGCFYAVGVGPGDPDLVTLRAARLVEGADVILAPQAKSSKSSIALRAVAPLLKDQEIVVTQYPMERNNVKTREHWGKIATDVAKRCLSGQSVVQVTLGDPLIFATSSYLMEALVEKLPADRIQTIPGISAYQMVAGCFNRPLTLQEDRLMIMSATDLDAVEKALDACETLVLFKAAGDLPRLLELLRRKQLLQCAELVSAGGQGEHEVKVADLSQWDEVDLGYMTTMIIHIGQRPWQEGPTC
ncbi:precorrin-2 C20-methyltransferase /cobalt-factor II C20-methyltransferase [Desulfuromusa kysingii]|uniref:Precorrin-2 C20-methyltransferase /cobalt-factor II C20-methyltransferase n=1 Tax=Desulfuromusa kysingii TaxID=37625 RepID=A0A1H4AI60_9BACT|nr:precorrin-2 C(20)-methyltransferase [Desulfuromusa kysingii]SEA35595.1 precorrin-2 C20-methyltransferase /cobalt-factor II C20-methyltransferase [Desulfuromusa kysingii]